MRFIFGAFIAVFVSFTASAFASEIETVHELPRETPPGNIAIGPDGRVFMSLHAFYGPEVRVVEVRKDGSTVPYPPKGWAFAPKGDGPGLTGVLGLRVDQDGVLWMLDGQTESHAGRLVGWDTNSETLHRIVYLPSPVVPGNAFLNDLAVDLDNQAIYIADPAAGTNSAIIVVDLETGRARRVLEGTEFVNAGDVDMVIDDRLMTLGGNPARVGINPITIDPENEWLYFGPMSGNTLYRVKTAHLNDPDLDPEDLASRVEAYGERPISDGATIDGEGNVYITDITNDAIGVVKPDGSYEVLFQRDEISWPDGYAYGPDDKIYVVINELHRSPVLNGGEDGSLGEFKIMRFEPLAGGATGR
ncbi:MAG: L-dopachrome tautomerase-related protein [Pseudomonadota bacterium]